MAVTLSESGNRTIYELSHLVEAWRRRWLGSVVCASNLYRKRHQACTLESAIEDVCFWLPATIDTSQVDSRFSVHSSLLEGASRYYVLLASYGRLRNGIGKPHLIQARIRRLIRIRQVVLIRELINMVLKR